MDKVLFETSYMNPSGFKFIIASVCMLLFFYLCFMGLIKVDRRIRIKGKRIGVLRVIEKVVLFFIIIYIIENKNDKKRYAVKIFNINPEIGFTGENQKDFLRESTILQKLDHKSIVKFVGINFQSFADPIRLEPSIITEYLPNKSLKEDHQLYQ